MLRSTVCAENAPLFVPINSASCSSLRDSQPLCRSVLIHVPSSLSRTNATLSPPFNACLRVCKPAFCCNRLCSVVFNPKPASVPSACAASLITPNAHSCAYQVYGHSMYARLPLPHLPACHPPMRYRYASLSPPLFSRTPAMHLSIHTASLSCPFALQTTQTAVHKHATQHANKM